MAQRGQKPIPNSVRHIPEENLTIVTVTRRDNSQHEILLDSHVYDVLSEFQFTVMRTRWGRNDFYARVTIDKKQRLLHRVVGVRYLLEGMLEGKNEIDHKISTETLDCRLQNLQAADRFDQMNNTRRSKNRN